MTKDATDFGARSRNTAARALGRCAALGVAATLTMGFGAAGVGPSAHAQSAVEIDLSGFDAWLADFKARARAAGVPDEVLEAAFDGVVANPKVIEFDRRQAEFTRAIWEYLARAVSEKRVADGRAAALAQGGALDAIEAAYGVPKEVIVAIWGVESAYGANRGDFGVIRAMATLAYEGRRKKRFEAELIAALLILKSGDVGPESMVGSWAGAMGHTQFMPSSYLELAVDFDGDGKRNIWSENPVDALASTAQYLAARGWRPGEPWGLEITLPAGFDYRLLDGGPRDTDFWSAQGVTLASGGPLPTGIRDGAILLPAGAQGPAFLAFANFRALLSYNPATAYALAVALLAERIAGAPAHAFGWPVEDRPLGREAGEELQRLLTSLGFDTGGIDGILGANTRAAIRRFQAANGLVADGYASERLLDYVRRAVDARGGPVIDVADSAPTTADIREIQALLLGLGYDVGTVDGVAGRRTTRALGRFVATQGLALDAEPSREILAALRRAVRGE